MCDYRRGFGLVTRFIDQLYTWLVTTCNHSAIANLHNSQITTLPAKPFPAYCLFNSRSLATASNNGDSSASQTSQTALLNILGWRGRSFEVTHTSSCRQFNFLLVLLALAAHMTRSFSFLMFVSVLSSATHQYDVRLEPWRISVNSEIDLLAQFPDSCWSRYVDWPRYGPISHQGSPNRFIVSPRGVVLLFRIRTSRVRTSAWVSSGLSWYSSVCSGNAGIVTQVMPQSSSAILMSREKWKKIYCGRAKDLFLYRRFPGFALSSFWQGQCGSEDVKMVIKCGLREGSRCFGFLNWWRFN
jgi:hypothetical protein